MRFLPPPLVLVIALAGHLAAQTNNDPITTVGTIPAKTIKATLGSPVIDLSTYFAVPSLTGQTVLQFANPGVGTFNVVMNATAAPNTVQNFLAYVTAGSYTDSFVHRSSPGVIQGGSYLIADASLYQIATAAPIPMETSDTLENVAGTIAMARNGLNTATSGWFINVSDNSGSYSPASANDPDRSYAVFGRVTGTGLSVVNAMAALPVPGGTLTVTSSSTTSSTLSVDATTLPTNFGAGWGLFTNVPSPLLPATVQGQAGFFVSLTANAPLDISTPTSVGWSRVGPPFTQLPVLTALPPDNTLYLSNFVKQSSITSVPIFPATAGGSSVVTFSAVSSNPSLVNATVSGSNLILLAAKNLNGQTQVTVTATDSNGNSVSQTAFNVTVQKQVVDLSGDGSPDFVFQNTAGQIYAWLLDGTGNAVNFTTGSGVVPGSNYLYPSGLADWRMMALADVDGDGIPDIVFQNNIGQIYVWYLDGTGNAVNINTGTGLKRSGYLYSGGLADWRVMAVADVDEDGIRDLVFQNSIGQIYVWYLDGTGNAVNVNTGVGLKRSGYLYSGGLADWRVMAVADVNGDGIPDLVFQNNLGQIYKWSLDGSGNTVNFSTGSGVRPGSNYLYTAGLADWKIRRIADVNGDGISDIVFQNNSGQIYVWFLDGTGNAVNFSSGSGVKPGSNYLYSGFLADWRLR